MDKTKNINQKWLVDEIVLFLGPEEVRQSGIQSDNSFESYLVYKQQADRQTPS